MHARGLISVLGRVLAPVEIGEPAPANSAPPLRREEHPGVQIGKLEKKDVPCRQDHRVLDLSVLAWKRIKCFLLFWWAIWHSCSKPLKLCVPLDPADLHLEYYPKETT